MCRVFRVHTSRQVRVSKSIYRDMPPAKRARWEHRPQRAVQQPARVLSFNNGHGHSDCDDTDPNLVSESDCTVIKTSMSASDRRQLYARLLWLDDYRPLFQAEGHMNESLMQQLKHTYTSAHTRRLMNRDTLHGARTIVAVEARLRDCVGFLERSRNQKIVPITQAAKSIAYIASGVQKPVWVAERKLKRVACREYAVKLLSEMTLCRPPPEFEVQDRSIICSIAFVQTYAKAGAGTGISKYNAIQTVDANGDVMNVERMVYINGQFFAVPRAQTELSDVAKTLIQSVGPYTQDFRRVLPLLQPDRLDYVMDNFMRRAVKLLGGQPPSSTIDGMQRLLSRPADDPVRPTYLTFMTPLLWVNTQSYIDMIKIVNWCMGYIMCGTLILHMIGDGQSVLRLRDLKRMHPLRYRHVLIGNGHFHSGAHSMFADVTLWWWCLLCRCMVTIGKVSVEDDGTFKGTVRPGIRSLESNAVEHTQHGLLAVTVAIMVFLTTKVTSPPPSLFHSNPIAYISRVNNASGIVLCQFLRHSGLPTLFWQRGTRGREGSTLDDLHCLALHKFRCAHKTSSTQISLLHLISIFGTHPELRAYLRSRLFVSLTANVGAAVGTDRSVECMNEVQKEHNVGASLIQSLSFTKLIQPMQYVYRQWKIAMGSLAACSTGVRASMVNEIDALVRLFEAEVGTDLETYTTHNNLWHTGGKGVDMRSGPNMKRGRPWEWVWKVAEGMSKCLRDGELETWINYVERHIREHMFSM